MENIINIESNVDGKILYGFIKQNDLIYKKQPLCIILTKENKYKCIKSNNNGLLFCFLIQSNKIVEKN